MDSYLRKTVLKAAIEYYKKKPYDKALPVPYGNIIREIRLLREVTQQQLADYLNVSQNTYSKMESKNVTIKNKRLIKVAEFLNFDIEEIEPIIRDYFEETYVRDEMVIDFEREMAEKYVTELEEKNDYLTKTVKAQEETILLLKEKIAALENKK